MIELVYCCQSLSRTGWLVNEMLISIILAPMGLLSPFTNGRLFSRLMSWVTPTSPSHFFPGLMSRVRKVENIFDRLDECKKGDAWPVALVTRLCKVEATGDSATPGTCHRSSHRLQFFLNDGVLSMPLLI